MPSPNTHQPAATTPAACPERQRHDTQQIAAPEWLHYKEQMLVFLTRWAPFGGGSSVDIWEQFGVNDREYFRRMQILLATSTEADLGISRAEIHQLRRVCTRRQTCVKPSRRGVIN